MNRPAAAVVLPLRFAWALLASGVQTIGVILQRGLRIGAPPPAAFVRIGFAPMHEQGVALLACMISLTPGTTVIDIDLPARQMVVHMLDARAAAATVAAIRRQFEPPLLAWFGERAR
ncbi:MAG: Na+/H+ antiporter subunit E [Rubrivivax sp.]|nr:Na+/H+ antiporter subunit E [Rubrivivax sp.]